MSDIKEVEDINFKRDEIGSIYPSDLSNLKKEDSYVFFCGGSTLEASQVKEGERPPDIFARESNQKAINLARANQNLKGCILKVNDFNNYLNNPKNSIKKPSKYVLSTNINSLSSFLRDKYKVNQKQNTEINHFGTNSLIKVKELFKRYKRNNLFKEKLSIYEHSILDGCCFAPSEINKRRKNSIILKWDNNKLLDEYKEYLEKSLSKLEIVMERNKISKRDIIFSIEPNSFNIPLNKFLRPYWKGIDPRQKLYSNEGYRLTNKESAVIIKKFDDVYFDIMKKNKFKVLRPNVELFPQWSFFDAVHYTDEGSKFLGKYFYKNL